MATMSGHAVDRSGAGPKRRSASISTPIFTVEAPRNGESEFQAPNRPIGGRAPRDHSSPERSATALS